MSAGHVSDSSISWASHPQKELLRLAGPITVSMLSYATMTLVGSLFVSPLGAPQLAGVGLAGVALFSLLCFPMGLLTGMKVLVSQAVGARDEVSARSYRASGIFFAALMGAMVLCGAELLALLMPRVASSQESAGFAQTYLRIRGLGSPIVLLFTALREASYARGNSKSPMQASLAGNILNIASDTFLIFYCHFGVTGAAIGAVLGQTLEFSFLAVTSKAWRGWVQPKVAELKAVMRIGFPSALQFLLEVGSFAVLTVLVASMGDTQMAAHQIVLQLLHFGFLPAVAVGEAASVLAGQAIGAKRDEMVLRVAHRALWIVSFYSAMCSAIYFFFGRLLISAFTSVPATAVVAMKIIAVACTLQVFDGAAIVARAVLKGTGDVRFCAIAGAAVTWLILPPLTYVMGIALGYGAVGGWVGICTQIFVAMVLFWLRLQGGGWKKTVARSRSEKEKLACDFDDTNEVLVVS